MAQFSMYVHKSGLTPDLFHFIFNVFFMFHVGQLSSFYCFISVPRCSSNRPRRCAMLVHMYLRRCTRLPGADIFLY